MRLTNRDIKIINFIDNYKGATIEQIRILFFPSYDMAKKRLKILRDNNYIKCVIHPVLNKKVYYLKKVPSYHTLVINEVQILLKERIVDFKREFKIDKFKVDGLLVTRDKKVVVVEVDIFNRTSKEKVNKVKACLKAKLKIDVKVIVVAKEKRKNKGEWIEIGIEEIEKIAKVI